MAVDTRSKRASSVQILTSWIPAPVLPDGTISQADRQHIAHTYSGILASGGVTTPTDRNFTPFSRSNNADPQSMRNHTPNTSSRGSTA